MAENLSPKIKCSEIRDILATKTPNDIWLPYFEWVKTLLPFWENAIVHISTLKNLDIQKTEKHLEVLKNAFELMDDWRFERVKYLKNKRKEIDNAISFIRNQTQTFDLAYFLFTPICRNAASILRSSLYIAAHGYEDNQIPTVVAQHIYTLASLKTFFPLDIGGLVKFLPTGNGIHGMGSDLDNYHLMLENAGKALGIEKEIAKINETAFEIWTNFDKALAWDIPDFIWTTKRTF